MSRKWRNEVDVSTASQHLILELALHGIIQSIISPLEEWIRDESQKKENQTYAHEVLAEKFAGGMVCCRTAIFPPMVAKVPASASKPYSTRRESGFGQWSLYIGKDNGAHIDVNISCIGVDLHILKVHTSSCEVVHVDGPLTIWRNIGRAVLSRGSHPYERLVAEVSREIDDDVCVVDAVFIG